MIRLGEEIFRSVQGEGPMTGRLSIWVRFFSCNLTCAGFFQNEPTKPETYHIPQALTCGKSYTSLKDVPILYTGCDSGYSWHPNFKHLQIKKSTAQAVSDIQNFLYENCLWEHPDTHNTIDLCITGGEPMLYQGEMALLLTALRDTTAFGCATYNGELQIETNTTRKLDSRFSGTLAEFNPFWNMSPKLYNVSGEKDRVNYDRIMSYYEFSKKGCLKFVVNDREDTWIELNEHVRHIRSAGCDLPVFVMPVGATYEQQTDTEVLSKIANRAIAAGYHVTGRLQATLFGNGVGT